MEKTLDFLVTCVDNFGDIGFALDLGESLLSFRPEWKIRFFCDNREVFDQLCQGRIHPNIFYYELSEYENSPPSKEIFSFFDRKLPQEHFEKFAYSKKILQFSCLRFDSGVGSMNGTRYTIGNNEFLHLVPSPIPWWTGIVIGRKEIPPEIPFQAVSSKQQTSSSVHVFCYPETLAKIEMIARVSSISFTFSRSTNFLRFDAYAEALKTFPANIVRWENSAIKAMLAWRPFIWDFYKEENGAHGAKIEDFLQFVEPFFEDRKDFLDYAGVIRTFNGEAFYEPEAMLCAKFLLEPSEKTLTSFQKIARGVQEHDIVSTLLQEIETEKSPRRGDPSWTV